jgi:single-strand DNA-binding protein
MFHRVTIIGHLGNDPEMRHTQKGTPVASFSVASSRRWTGQDGQQGEETVWFRVSAWNRLGEICNQYLSKGSKVYVEGQLTPDKETGGPRTYVANGGQLRATYELRATTVRFLDSAGTGGNNKVDEVDVEPITEEEIPF